MASQLGIRYRGAVHPACRYGAQWFVRTLLLGAALSAAGIKASAVPGDAVPGVDAPLRFGVLPFASPVSLFQRFAPLRDHVADHAGVPVVLESARDYSVHVQRIEAGDFDLVLTAPHFVPIALDSGHYRLIAGHGRDLFANYLVARGDPARDLGDLAGRSIATPPAEALITIIGKRHLLDHLGPEAPAPRFIAYPSHNAAVHAVDTGLAGAAIASSNVARSKANGDGPIRVLEESDRFPGVGILVHRRVPAALQERIAEILISMNDTKEGRDVIRRMDYGGYRAVSAQAYEALRTMLPEIRGHLESRHDSP